MSYQYGYGFKKPTAAKQFSIGYTDPDLSAKMEALATATGQTKSYWGQVALKYFFDNIDVEQLSKTYALIEAERAARLKELMERVIVPPTKTKEQDTVDLKLGK